MNSTVMQTLQNDKQVKHGIPKGAPVPNPPTFPQSAQPQNSALAADSGHINSRADASYSIIHSEIASVPNALQGVLCFTANIRFFLPHRLYASNPDI